MSYSEFKTIADVHNIDLREYYIRDTGKLLGILAYPFQEYFGTFNHL